MTQEAPKTEEQKPAEGAKPEGEQKPVEQKPAEKPDSEKTVEELKAEAEAAEAEYKAKRGSETEEEIRQNQIRRRDKARAKAADLAAGRDGDEAPKSQDLATRDLITLGKADIAEESDKAKILAKYKAGGIISSYAEGLDHPAIKAEFAELDSKNNAKTVIDENDSPENRLKTKKEIVDGYKKTGEVPEDPELQKAIAESNLADMPQVR